MAFWTRSPRSEGPLRPGSRSAPACGPVALEPPPSELGGEKVAKQSLLGAVHIGVDVLWVSMQGVGRRLHSPRFARRTMAQGRLMVQGSAAIGRLHRKTRPPRLPPLCPTALLGAAAAIRVADSSESERGAGANPGAPARGKSWSISPTRSVSPTQR